MAASSRALLHLRDGMLGAFAAFEYCKLAEIVGNPARSGTLRPAATSHSCRISNAEIFNACAIIQRRPVQRPLRMARLPVYLSHFRHDAPVPASLDFGRRFAYIPVGCVRR